MAVATSFKYDRLLKEYVLPISFRTIDDEVESMIMNLYLPIPAVYNSASLEERYKMYAIFLIVNIHNLVRWLNCKPRETYIAKITNINTESKQKYNTISCDEMLRIIRRSAPDHVQNTTSTYIIIFSGDSIMNTASLDIYPLKFNIYVSLGLAGYNTRFNSISYPIYIKNLMINNPEVERYVIEYGRQITLIIERAFGADLVRQIHQYYDWDFCSRSCRFIW